MDFYIKATFFLILSVLVWYIFGTVTLRILKQKEANISHKILAGYISYNFLFFVLAMILKMAQVPLSWLSISWMICIGAMGIGFIRIMVVDKPYKQWKGQKILPSDVISIVVLIFVMAVTVKLAWDNGSVGSAWDDSYYIGDVSVSVYTNTISTHNPYTGEKLAQFHTEYFFETLETHSAVISQVFGIHPILVVKYIQAGMTAIIYYMVLYAAGMLLCWKERRKSVLFAVAGALVLLFGYGWLNASGFYFLRSGEGKTLQALVLLPLVFYQLLRISYDSRANGEWKLLFMLVCASFGLNMSTLFLLPVLLGAGIISLKFVKKEWRIVRNGLICLLPCLLIGIVYIGMTEKFFSIPVR